jgi:peptidoglycan/LPS O-acetylase OafA/YrhL
VLIDSQRIPALDGLRAVSIVLVLLGHLPGTGRFLPLSSVAMVGDIGNLGVCVFFVISGLLITTLLLNEQSREGRIDLPAFYLRRAFRILPAAGFYLLAVAAVGVVVPRLSLPASDWLHALTFTTNYQPHRTWWVGHLWSLSVEEQFYVLWPVPVLLLGRRRSLWLAGSAVWIAPLWRAGVWVFQPDWRDGIGETFPTVMDAIASGCLLAGYADWLATRAWYRRFLASPLPVLVLIAVLVCNAFDRYPWFFLPFGMTLRNVGIAVLVHWSMLQSHRVVAMAFDSAAVAWIARTSDSLYLWQQPFLDRHVHATLTTFPINFTGALLCAVLSFVCIEKPALRLRGRLVRPGTRPRPATSVVVPAAPL